MTMFHSMLDAGHRLDERESNLLDGGAPFHTTCRTTDDGVMAVGAIESFYAEFAGLLGFDLDLDEQYDRGTWSETRRRIGAAFSTRSRRE